MAGGLAVTVLLLLAARAISGNCPPSSGNIYLTQNGNCFSNGSYFLDNMSLDQPLSCILPDSTLNDGEWFTPTGPNDCSANPIRCIEQSSPANISLYFLQYQFLPLADDGWFRCCLPDNCSSPSTNVIFAYIYRWAQIENITVDLPSESGLLPQTYTLHAIQVGLASSNPNEVLLHNATWFYESGNTSIDLTQICDGTVLESGYSCIVGTVVPPNSSARFDFNLTVTWNGEGISGNGLLGEFSDNGDHTFRFYLKYGLVNLTPAVRNRYVTLSAPSIPPSSVSVLNKTATTITVGWTAFDSSEADGYGFSITGPDSQSNGRIQDVNQNTVLFTMLNGTTNYNITIRAFQQLLGPGSRITVQTLAVISSINWTLVSSITQLNNTQYRIDCLTTTDINPLTDVYWLVNGVMKSNSMYTLIDALTYNNTLLVYPDPLGASVNVTCIATMAASTYTKSVILNAPSGPPNNVQAFILDGSSILVNWALTNANGYVIEYRTGATVNRSVTTTNEFILNDVSLTSIYTINVYAYIDLPSIDSTSTAIKFDIPSPVTSFLATNVSSTDIMLNWTIPSSEDDSYVTYYIISSVPLCQELQTVNNIVSVVPHPSTTSHSYTLQRLHSAIYYTVHVRAGNPLGISQYSNGVTIAPISIPTGSPMEIFIDGITRTIEWNEIDCVDGNNSVTGYIVLVSNSSVTYNYTSTDRHIILNDLGFDIVYNISIAAVNEFGIGPFTDPVIAEFQTIGSIFSTVDATWARITWSPPNIVSLDYPVITYEIGYQQSNDVCQESINILATNLTNVSSTSFNITGLTPDTRYVFAVRAYTSNGYGEWSLVTNETLAATIFITVDRCVVPTQIILIGNETEITSTGSKTVSIAFGTAIAILIVALMISLVINICLCFCTHRRSKNNTTNKEPLNLCINNPHSSPQEDEQEIVMQLCEPYGLKNAILAKQNETGGEESKANHTTSGLDAVYDYTDHDQNDYGNDPEYIYIPNMEALKDKGQENDYI